MSAVERLLPLGLVLVAPPDAAVVSMRALPPPTGVGQRQALNVYAVASLLEKKGWNLFTGQNPACLSICLGESHSSLLAPLLADLEQAVRFVAEHPGQVKVDGSAAV